MPNKRIKLPSRDELLAIFDYCPLSGDLRWRERPGEPVWNGRNAGKLAGTVRKDGYIAVSIPVRGTTVPARAHRIAYKILHDEEPEIVDHRWGVDAGNTRANLRASDPMRNAWNSRGSRKKDLPKNVYACKGGFKVAMQTNGVKYERVGFKTWEAADEHARAKERELRGDRSAPEGIANAALWRKRGKTGGPPALSRPDGALVSKTVAERYAAQRGSLRPVKRGPRVPSWALPDGVRADGDGFSAVVDLGYGREHVRRGFLTPDLAAAYVKSRKAKIAAARDNQYVPAWVKHGVFD